MSPEKTMLILDDGEVAGIQTAQTWALMPTKGAPLSRCPTSLDLTSPRGKALAIAAGNPSDLDCTDGKPLEIVVTDWLVFWDASADEATGELSEFPRTVFFTREGKTFRTSSAHAPARLQAILDLYDESDWKRGITIVVTPRMGKRKRVYHDIRVRHEGD